MHLVRSLLAATASAALVVSLAPAAAHAAVVTFEDARGDLDHKADLQWVKVTNGGEKLSVVAKIKDIRPRRYNQSASLYLDTDPADGGPEFRLSGGLTDGTDYALTRTERWKPSDRVRWVDCHYTWRVDWDADIVRAVMENECFEGVDEFRVAFASFGQNPRPGTGTTTGPVFTDWLGDAARTWTGSVPRG